MRPLLWVTVACSLGLLQTCNTANITEGQPAAEAPTDAERDKIGLEELKHLVRPGVGRCESPVADPKSNQTFTTTCYSPGITLRPGQIEDAFYFLPSPYPAGQTVGAIKHTSAIVDDTGREVPLSEVYLHHIFGPGDFLVGEGAEHRGSFKHPELQAPHYLVIPADKYTDKSARLINIHVISTLGVPADKVQPCIECWCTAPNGTFVSDKRGGGQCCSRDNCPSTLPNTTTTTYKLQYNVTYRVLEAGEHVEPVYSLMLDGVGGSIEYDVQAGEGAQNKTLVAAGPIDGRCPQTQPLRVLRCLGHQHIGGTQLRLVNADTNEVICKSDASYGTGPRDEIGNEGSYLVSMSMDAPAEQIMLQPGLRVRIESEYKAEEHYGVMALMFLDLVGFDRSCPGLQARAGSNSTDFGPDFAHMRSTAFGFYDGQVFDFGRLDPSAAGANPDSPAAAASKVLGEQNAAEAASSAGQSEGPSSTLFLVGFYVGAVLVVGAGVAAVVLHRRRRLAYTPLNTESAPQSSV